MGPMETAEPAIAARATALDATWLSTQRWFRSKTRRMVGLVVEDAAALGADAWLLVMRATFADGHTERYLVPAAAGPDGELREPRDGEGAWRAMLASLASGEAPSGSRGRFTLHPIGTLETLLPGGAAAAGDLDERRLRVEQSNTSVRLGERLIMKVYRLLEPGTNPEVEVNAFLTEAGFPFAPALAGWIAYAAPGEEPATAVMLQELVPAHGDAWAWALARLGDTAHGHAESITGTALIGRITAEMHAALGSRPERDGFPARAAEPAELRAWRTGAEQQLDGALAVVSGRDRDRLAKVAGKIRYSFSAMEKAASPLVSRIHGDYHLGQLLRTDTGFMVIDFEGEPARPLAERRQPQSPLRDVAGMLRSLDYAARSAERATGGGFSPEAWLVDARKALLGAYGEGAAGQANLLRAFEAEKACYEVRYEANNRPDWTWLPIAALERIAA
jgi:maltokinase